jgi:hypothetical protein
MRGLVISKKRCKRLIKGRNGILNGLVKVTDATTGLLKRWETQRGKPMAVMENGSLILTKIGRHMGYKVSNKELTNSS